MPESRDFVDRTEEIDRLDLLLKADGITRDSFILLHGQTGIGKTQLLFRYLRICNHNTIHIAYIDLEKKAYSDVIDKIVEGLGQTGFEVLYRTYDELSNRFSMDGFQAAAKHASEQIPISQNNSTGLIFNQPISADQQIFVSGNVTFENTKVTNIFSVELSEPQQVQNLNQRKITQAFHDCLHALSKEKQIVILLDHWERASDPLKTWLNEYLLRWASELKLKKALVIVSRESLPAELENQAGILPLRLPPFSREAALEFWEKNKLPLDIFDTLTAEIYSLPQNLVLEVGRHKLRNAGKQ